MTKLKLVERNSLKPPKSGRKRAVLKKRFRDDDGKETTLLTIETSSPSFDGDLLHIFGVNVAAARQANTAVIGKPDAELPAGSRREAKKMVNRVAAAKNGKGAAARHGQAAKR